MTKQDQQEFKKLVKEGTLEALKSKEGKDVLLDSFVEGFHEVIVPVLGDMSDDIKELKSEIRYTKDNHETRLRRLERKAGLISQ